MSAPSKALAKFPGFNRLSPNVWYYAKKQEASTAATNSPDLIILAAWMGAAPKHIIKYIAGHQTKFPTSPILLITNEAPDILLYGRKTNMNKLRPALPVIEKTIQEKKESQQRARIFLHVFSNGGTNQIRYLAQLWKESHNSPLPVTSAVIDSAPGSESYQKAVTAFSYALPKFWPLRILGLSILHFSLVSVMLFRTIFRSTGWVEVLRKDLNDKALFLGSAPRTYVYSDTDELIDSKDVESHSKDAVVKGWKSKTELFVGSKHVGHMMADPDKYWAIVVKAAANDEGDSNGTA